MKKKKFENMESFGEPSQSNRSSKFLNSAVSALMGNGVREKKNKKSSRGREIADTVRWAQGCPKSRLGSRTRKFCFNQKTGGEEQRKMKDKGRGRGQKKRKTFRGKAEMLARKGHNWEDI